MREVRWWWVRHAPVIAAPGVIAGQLDLPCDTTGDGIARLAARLPADAAWIVTPLRRTAETAAALHPSSRPEWSIEPDFAEQHFGRWQGLTHPALDASGDDAYRRFWDDPARTAPPEGESFQALVSRVASAIQRIGLSAGAADIVAVAHAGTIRAAIGLALDVSGAAMLRLQIDPLSLTRIDQLGSDSWSVVSVNAMSCEQ